jgi:transcriptional antiterminator RfaH
MTRCGYIDKGRSKNLTCRWLRVRHGDGGSEVSTSWYAVQAKRNAERRVVHRLALKSILSFLPLIEVVRRYAERRVVRVEPLFPGYLFAQMDALDRDPSGWDALRLAPGVRRILGTEEAPVPVPEDVIASIQARVRDLGFIRPGPQFTRGSMVSFRHGLLSGLEAIFEMPMSRAGRVRVLLELLGQPRVLEVDEIDLETA